MFKIIITNKLQNSERWFYAAQGVVVLVIFETAINAASMENIFLKKAKKLQSASEYRKVCMQ